MVPEPSAPVAELPPRPDPRTGEPRPPRAPAFRSSRSERTVQQFPNGSFSSAAEEPPQPPDGEGPALGWEGSNPREQLKVGAIGLAVLVVGVSALRGFDLSWMTSPLHFLVILVVSALVGLRARKKPLAVGAEWLRVGRHWVRLYELSEIHTTRWKSELHLLLTDRNGRRVGVHAERLRERPPMYDLVYNGMLHSVVTGGAETQADGVLDLPSPAAAEHARG